MLVFCDETWKQNQAGKKVGTLAGIAIPREAYNGLTDRVFLLAQKYWGLKNAREREIKGRSLISQYEFRREAHSQTSMKLSFAREILEELRGRGIRVFASVVYSEHEVDLLCEDPELIDRAYWYLMERIHECAAELEDTTRATITFDDRGLGQNARVASAYTNFLARSKTGRSYHTLMREPFFADSKHSVGIQLADLVCTVINRFHTIRDASPRIVHFWHIVEGMQWVAAAPNEVGYVLKGIKVLGDQ